MFDQETELEIRNLSINEKKLVKINKMMLILFAI